MLSFLLILGSTCFSVGAISADEIGSEPATSLLAPNYTLSINQSHDARRDPDRILFTATVNDTANDRQYPVGLSPEDEIRAFEWSQGKTAYAFVQGDQVYYVPRPDLAPVKVSNSSESGIIHGTFDWVYNEEIFMRHRVQSGALWFSPSDKYLAYASRHANSSRKAMMTTYSSDFTYDYHYEMEYPKTGEKGIAEFSVSIWNGETEESVTMDVQLKDRKSFHYLFEVSWVTLHGEEILVVTFANRWQNETAVTLCLWETATCTPIYEHKYAPSQWASPEDYSNLVHSNSSLFFLLPQIRDDNAWQHIAKVDVTVDFQLGSVSFLPAGAYDVHRVIAYRAEEAIVFYEAQAPYPWNKHIYGTPAGPQNLLNEDQCLTCGYRDCTYQEFREMTRMEDSLNISLFCKGPGLPYTALVYLNSSSLISYNFSASPSTSQEHRNWTIETFMLPSGYEATVKIYEGNAKLPLVPVILHVYGGPTFNQATDEHKYVPDPIGYGDHAIVHIDVRGSGGRGWKYRSAIYRRLVTVEVEDTLEAMKMVLAKYPQLDKNRVGANGWSYGGTLTTALVELAPPAFFKCASVGAPVTNFLFYDVTYTERFMGDTSPSSYVDLTKDVQKFRNTSLLLVHGLRDDNVHFQNSALLIESLQVAEIPFQLMVYPNQDHGTWLRKTHAGNHRTALYKSFFSTCFQ